MNFPEKLQMLRKGKNLSQEEFAEVMGVSRQSVSKWESGQSYPEIEKLIEISNYCNVSLDYLLKEANRGTASEEMRNNSCVSDVRLMILKLKIKAVFLHSCACVSMWALIMLHRLPSIYLFIIFGILFSAGTHICFFSLCRIRDKITMLRQTF